MTANTKQNMIEVVVTANIHYEANQVFAALQDFTNYNRWWHIPVKTLDNGEKCFLFNPLPLINIILKQNRFIVNREIEYEYVKGPFRGRGKWIIERLANKTTKITYVISLYAINKLIYKIANTKAFRRKHAGDIYQLIANLENYISKQQF